MSAADLPAAVANTQNPNHASVVIPRLTALEHDVRVLQTGEGSQRSRKTLSIHHLSLCLPSDIFSCSGTEYFHSRGRLVRRLVSLYDTADDMLAEADRRTHAANTGIAVNHTNGENRLYKTYKELQRWIPSIRDVPQTHIKDALRQIGKGADCGRNEDTHKLKGLVVHWLMEGTPKPNPPLSITDKSGRGFYNDATGKLLCPVDYDWNDPSHRQNIRDFHPDFLVTAHSWPAFLYPDGKFDPENPSEGLFEAQILMRAFKAIFISPTSTEDLGDEFQDSRTSKKRSRGDRRTRSNIASLIGMNTVQPRSIAYVACQLRFALSSCGSWALVDNVFDSHEFYYAIVEWFEELHTEHERKFVDELLLRWNRAVFGPTFAFALKPDRTASKSVARSMKKCRISIEDVGAHSSVQ